MRKPDARIYARFHRVDPAAYAAIKSGLEYVQAAWKDNILDLEHEGHYIDVDGLVEHIAATLPPTAWGKLDFIDDGEWRLSRYVFENGGVRVKVMDINNVLDPLNTER